MSIARFACVQVNKGVHSFELTSNSSIVRSVPSEPEDQGSNPGLVTLFPKNKKKVCAKYWEEMSLEPRSKRITTRSPTTTLVM
jgi:hypothetical protein